MDEEHELGRSQKTTALAWTWALGLGALSSVLRAYLNFDDHGLLNIGTLCTLLAGSLSALAALAIYLNWTRVRAILLAALALQVPFVASTRLVWSFNSFGGPTLFFEPGPRLFLESDYTSLSIILIGESYTGPFTIGLSLFPLAIIIGYVVHQARIRSSSKP